MFPDPLQTDHSEDYAEEAVAPWFTLVHFIFLFLRYYFEDLNLLQNRPFDYWDEQRQKDDPVQYHVVDEEAIRKYRRNWRHLLIHERSIKDFHEWEDRDLDGAKSVQVRTENKKGGLGFPEQQQHEDCQEVRQLLVAWQNRVHCQIGDERELKNLKNTQHHHKNGNTRPVVVVEVVVGHGGRWLQLPRIF